MINTFNCLFLGKKFESPYNLCTREIFWISLHYTKFVEWFIFGSFISFSYIYFNCLMRTVTTTTTIPTKTHFSAVPVHAFAFIRKFLTNHSNTIPKAFNKKISSQIKMYFSCSILALENAPMKNSWSNIFYTLKNVF